jgi:hypothetical protein
MLTIAGRRLAGPAWFHAALVSAGAIDGRPLRLWSATLARLCEWLASGREQRCRPVSQAFVLATGRSPGLRGWDGEGGT